MVVTTLEGHVATEREDDLVREFNRSTATLPPPIAEVFLLHARDSDVWRIVTVWRSADDLDEYRRSVDIPEGVQMFRAADAEPALDVFGVAGYAAASPTAVVS